jgi:hypothetical protein
VTCVRNTIPFLASVAPTLKSWQGIFDRWAWPSSFFIMPPELSRKRCEQFALAARIAKEGIEMLACSFCRKNGKLCVVSSESTRCSECVRIGKRCDVAGPSVSDWKSLEAAEEKLELEAEKAEAAMAEAAARLARLRKQRRFLKKRGAEMLRRGLSSMDELEAVEEREQLEGTTIAAASSAVPDFSFVEEPLPDFSDAAFWESLGFAGGTPQASQGNS